MILQSSQSRKYLVSPCECYLRVLICRREDPNAQVSPLMDVPL
ncbi:hypothetical protein RDI58_004068 [Solanum bulbocastanum]|uniref:Uncharacterized protein n=1 Tax=Solanum bulbocastanum TaxID=147425 RepID=A0AAN8U5U8_SOLBU